LLVLLGVAVAVVVLRIRTDRGEVTLQTDDPDIELVVQKGGGIVRIHDPRGGQTWELDTGNFTLALADRPAGLAFDLPGREPFVLKRDGKGVLTVTRAPKPDRAAKRVPADSLKREDIPEEALSWPGGGDPAQAPPELAAILGDGRFRLVGTARFPAFSP